MQSGLSGYLIRYEKKFLKDTMNLYSKMRLEGIKKGGQGD